jgi:hypothetical protein
MPESLSLSPGLRRALLFLVVLVAAFSRLLFLDGDLADHDTWRQTETATQARNFLDEPNILYPRVDWGEPGPGYVEAEFQLFPWTVHLAYRLTGERPVLGRWFSILLFALSCWPFAALARRLLGERAVLPAVALFAFAPLVWRYTRTFMPDTMSLLFALVAIERFTAFLADERRSAWITAAVAMAGAILVKPTSVHLGLALAVLCWARWRFAMLAQGRLWCFTAIALLPSAAYYWHAAVELHAYGNTFGVISGGDSKWGSVDLWLRPAFWLELLRMDFVYGLSPLGGVLAAVGLVVTFVRGGALRGLAAGWGVAAVLYYCIAGRYCGHERGLHYHLFTMPLLALLAAQALVGLQGLGPRPGRVAFAMTALVLLHSAWMNLGTARMTSRLLLRAGKELAAISAPDDRVLVLSRDPARDGGVANNYEQPDVLFHARRKGRVLAYDAQESALLERELSVLPSIRWYVNIPAWNEAARPGPAEFRAFLQQRFRRAAGGAEAGYEIYAIGP